MSDGQKVPRNTERPPFHGSIHPAHQEHVLLKSDTLQPKNGETRPKLKLKGLRATLANLFLIISQLELHQVIMRGYLRRTDYEDAIGIPPDC